MVWNIISTKLFRWTKAQARKNMQTICQTQWSCIVSFLYFAQAMKYKVYEETVTLRDEGSSKNTSSVYKQALLNADIVFIDGIAMQIFDRVWQFLFRDKRKRTENLNGTDFLPYILEQTKDKKVGIIMSSVYDPKISKWPEWMDKWLAKLQEIYPHIEIIYQHQTLFSKRGEEFPFDELQEVLDEKWKRFDHILFLNGIGSPAQEIWTEEQRSFFEKKGIIVMNNGATIDYYSGFEKRAPQRIVKLRVGETIWRIIKQPKKNLHKFLAMFQIVNYWRYLIKKVMKK